MKSQRLEQFFLKSIELKSRAAQRLFVESETVGDSELRASLLKLLDYHAESESSSFFEVPLLEQDPSLARALRVESEPNSG
jgi:hypothetical protein